MIYFISGHRDISTENFKKYYVPMILDAISKDDQASFVVGDCKGVDSMAQTFIAAINPNLITVYHMFDKPRFLARPGIKTVGGFKDDVSRDAAMTENSDKDIAVIGKGRWTSGTAQNILRRYEREL